MTASPADAYRARVDQAKAALQRLDRRGAWLANFRGGTFVGALASAGFTIAGRLPRLEGWVLVAALLASYVFLAQWHQRVLTEEERQRLKRTLNERGLARLTDAWHQFAGKGERFLDARHPYLPDLDVFGQGSVFQLMDESATGAGEERLAEWLSAPAPPDVVRARQEAVRELAGELDFRQGLVIACRAAVKGKAHPGRFIAWAERESLLAGVRWARPLAFLLPLTFAVTASLAAWGPLSSLWAWGCFFALLGVVAAVRGPLGEAFEAIAAGEEGFVRFEEVFGRVEGHAFLTPALKAVQGRLTGTAPTASVALRSFSRRFGFAELKRSGQLHALIHVFTLWDVHVLFWLERWRAAHGPHVRTWFDALAELEALSSVAGYAHARPGQCFPTLQSEGAFFEAVALGHPLLHAPIANDVALGRPGPAAFVMTGSNMSGKTTLLRAMGLNVVLALAGAPVCAAALKLSALRVLTGMRVKDSLERGVSYFYAEVERIRDLLAAARDAQGQALFLLDEVLLGTNIRERQVASREIVRLFLETGAVGAVATHDLALTTFTPPEARLLNVHFEDQLVEGRMAFDYRLREGVVQGTNALRVLRQAGIDVHEEEG
jgi:hypothetical protein